MHRRYKLETVGCPLCGLCDFYTTLENAKELYLGMDEYFNVVVCRNCGMAWTNPRPTQDTIRYFYPDTAGYFSPNKDVSHPTGGANGIMSEMLVERFGYPSSLSAKRHKSRQFIAPYILRRIKLSHIPPWIPGGRLLDVGCAWGRYLAGMRTLGWEVYGLEIHAASADFARRKLGLSNVVCGTIEGIDLEPEFYNVVHGSMVLEHFHQPLAGLKKIRRALKPDGWLILSVPDFSGWEARIFGRQSYTLQVPQHLNHFTVETLSKMLDRAGFRTVDLLHQHVDRDWFASAAYTNRSSLVLKILKKALIRRGIIRPLVYLQALAGKTSRMTVYAQPK